MRLRLLNGTTVRALLPIERCIDLVRQAMTMVASDKTIQPIRQALVHPDRRGLLSMMPGYIGGPEWLGIKIMSVFPANFGTELGSHQGFVILFDPKNGAPRVIMDGREITAIRTAAATDVLPRPDAKTLAIFGYGEQAHTHLEAVPRVRKFERALVWGTAGRPYRHSPPALRHPALIPASAADLKFLHHLQQTRLGTSNRKAALES